VGRIAIRADHYHDRAVRGGRLGRRDQTADRRRTALYARPIVGGRQPRGAGGSLGRGAIAKAAPDGYTIGMGTASTLAINPAAYKSLPFDVLSDLVPICNIAAVPNIMSVNPACRQRRWRNSSRWRNRGRLGRASARRAIQACDRHRHPARGVFDRHPKLQVVIGHLGEGLPFMLPRLDGNMPTQLTELQRPLGANLRENVQYTFAGFNFPATFLDLLLEVGVDRIMFSVDHPYGSMAETRAFLDQIPVSASDRERIVHRNAERLFSL
jgi:hypothetical protein